jgi:hypothetical protein
MEDLMPRKTRLSVAAAIAAFAIAAFAPSAQAGLLLSSATNCESQSLSQVFLPWADPANYVLHPGGSFENGTPGWSLDGASVVGGNEPWKVGGVTDAKALAVPDGAEVTTAAICVGIEHPTLRLFSKQTSGAALGHLDVDVLFEDAGGNVQSLPIGAVGQNAWAPSQIMVLAANLLAGLPGEKTAVAFRFSAHGGSFLIDDVYVDPWSKH